MSWIKMRTSLLTDGRVREVSRKLSRSRHAIVGMLYEFWCLGDVHADENGILHGWSKNDIDDHLRTDSFCDSMPADWIETTPDGWVKLPQYHEHNGSTAKKRALEQKRQRDSRKSVGNASRSNPTREEKRRSTSTKVEVAPVVFPPELDTTECRSEWARWISYKKKRRQGYAGPESESEAIALAAVHGPTAFVKALQKARQSNWAGFFPEKFSGGGDFAERRAERESSVVEKAKALRAAQDAVMAPKQKPLAIEER